MGAAEGSQWRTNSESIRRPTRLTSGFETCKRQSIMARISAHLLNVRMLGSMTVPWCAAGRTAPCQPTKHKQAGSVDPNAKLSDLPLQPNPPCFGRPLGCLRGVHGGTSQPIGCSPVVFNAQGRDSASAYMQYLHSSLETASAAAS